MNSNKPEDLFPRLYGVGVPVTVVAALLPGITLTLAWLVLSDTQRVKNIDALIFYILGLAWCITWPRCVSLKQRLSGKRNPNFSDVTGAVTVSGTYRTEEFTPDDWQAIKKYDFWLLMFCCCGGSTIGWICARWVGFDVFWR